MIRVIHSFPKILCKTPLSPEQFLRGSGVFCHTGGFSARFQPSFCTTYPQLFTGRLWIMWISRDSFSQKSGDALKKTTLYCIFFNLSADFRKFSMLAEQICGQLAICPQYSQGVRAEQARSAAMQWTVLQRLAMPCAQTVEKNKPESSRCLTPSRTFDCTRRHVRWSRTIFAAKNRLFMESWGSKARLHRFEYQRIASALQR